MRNFFLSCLLWSCIPLLSLAVSDDFNIRVLVGGDVIPPTTPALLSVEPTAQNQLDVTWSLSTDNYLLGGYVLHRDNVAIATTTQNSFIDTGLTANTLYEYTVLAFDAAGNVSTTSSPLSATTLAVPIVATSTEPTQDTSSATKTLKLTTFAITTEAKTATIEWAMNRPTRYTLRWGRTDLYNGGYVTNELYQSRHQTSITDLEPGTTYVYELTAHTPEGAAAVIRTGQFTTVARADEATVPNVTKLQALATKDGVALQWELPEVASGLSVRIVRNHLGYPSDSQDGAVLYEGLASNFFDTAAFALRDRQYYAVFIKSVAGTVSSGAVVIVTKPSGTSSENATNTTAGTPIVVPEIPLFGLEVQQIQLLQSGEEQTFLDENISLSYKDSFTIRIEANALPRHLKSIIVTLLDPTNQQQSYSFLLRLNKDQTAYEATIAPLYVRGVSRVQVEIFDYERLLVGHYRKQVTFVVKENSDKLIIFPDAIVSSLRTMLPTFSAVLAVLLIAFFLWWRRGKEAEDNQ